MTEAKLSANQDPHRSQLKERTKAQIGAIAELVARFGGETAALDDVLPKPSSVRADDPEPNWTEEQVATARELAHSFGYGAEKDMLSGLAGGVRILEGGLAWKIAAEAQAFEKEGEAVAVFAGSAYRTIREDETVFLKERLGIELPAGSTEYTVAMALAKKTAGADTQEPLPYGYQVAEGNHTMPEATGQLVKISDSVLVLRVDRENYEEDGKPKYRHQPSTEALMRFLSDVLSASGDQVSPVGLITSNTYASRVPDALRAGLKNNRQFGVAMYGRETIASVKAEPVTPDSPLNQLPGDLRVMYDNLSKLLDELNQ